MSDYERKAWDALLDTATTAHRPGRLESLSQGIRQRAREAAALARSQVEQLPGAAGAIGMADELTAKAMGTLHTALVERGLNSVNPADVFAMFAGDGITVRSYGDVKELDLKHCDRSIPRRKERYIALAVAEGAASSLAVTGAAVSSTVTGGTTLPVAASAVRGDVTAAMVGVDRKS